MFLADKIKRRWFKILISQNILGLWQSFLYNSSQLKGTKTQTHAPLKEQLS